MVSRRTFVTSSVMGGAGVVGGAAALLAPPALSAQRSAPNPYEVMNAELARQARQAVKTMETRPGEGLRALARTLRLEAELGASTTMDADARRQIQREVQRQGRLGVLTRPLDPAVIATDMAEFGLTWPAVRGPIDVERRGATLDLVRNTGLSEYLRQLATALERQGHLIDQYPASASGIGQLAAATAPPRPQPVRFELRGVQFYEAWEICPLLRQQQDDLELLISVFCTFSMIWSNPALVGGCVFLSSALATTLIQLRFYSC